MTDSLKPGQMVRCTVTKAPRTPDAVQTIERLMRLDPKAKRGLKRGQRRRRQNMVVYNRGNRDWYKRAACGKQVQAKTGATWTMPFSPQIAPDLRSVASVVSVEAAK